ncbi:MAG: 50S ribosomal protein L32 [Deltaproteobacteria bacterium]|nr:50S ribosomal protein L32 [Deltaproteobacteria bacterium]
MPNPKKRHSRCKRGNRRAHDAMSAPAFNSCPQCGEPKRPHHICRSCGSYRGIPVIKKKEESV